MNFDTHGREGAHNRRKGDEPMTLEQHENRISVLEKLSEHCDTQRIEDRARMLRMEGKLDAHLIATSQAQVATATAVTELSLAVKELGQDVKQALEGAALAVAHETTWKVLSRASVFVGTGVMVAISAAWAIFTFVAK